MWRPIFILLLVSMFMAFVSEAKENRHLIPGSFDAAYPEPNRPTVLHFTPLEKESGTYEIADIQGTKIVRGKFHLNSAGAWETAVTLPQGFYELICGGIRSGLWVMPRFQGAVDPFFGMQTDVSRSPAQWYTPIMRLMERIGVGYVREYRSWINDEPKPGVWRSDTEGMFQLAAQSKVRILFYLTAPPAWMTLPEKSEKDIGSIYPRHLLRLEDSLVPLLQRRGGGMCGLQIENETPNRPWPPDAFLSELNACSYLVDKAGWKLPLICQGFPRADREQLMAYCARGLPQLVDVLAFHMYYNPDQMIREVSYIRSALAGSPKQGMPIWVTETGYGWPVGPIAKVAFRNGDPGWLRARPDDDRESAWKLARNTLIAKACGIEKFFPFRLGFLQEYSVNFGLLDFDRTPQRNFAAYAFCVRIASGKQYAGELRYRPSELISARIFSDRKNAFIAAVTGGTKPVTVDFSGIPIREIYRIDGSIQPRSGDGLVQITDGLAYLVVNREDMGKLIQKDTEEEKLLQYAANYRLIPRKNYPVTSQFADWRFPLKTNRYYLATPDRLEFLLYNLSNEPQMVHPELTLSPGGRISDFVSSPVKLASRSMAHISCRVNWDGTAVPIKKVLLTDRNGTASPITVEFFDTDKLTGKRQRIDKSRWHPNSAGEMKVSYDAKSETVSFHTEFLTPGWVYPEYALELPADNLRDVAAISFEIKVNQPITYSKVLLVYHKKQNDYAAIPYKAASQEWSRRMVLLPEGMRTRPIYRLRIGLGATTRSVDFSIRNLRFLRFPEVTETKSANSPD